MLIRLAALAALLAPAPALAWNAYQTANGDPLHWKTLDHTYRLDANLPPHFDPEITAQLIEAAFQQWSDVPCRPMTFTSQGYAQGAKVDASDGVNWVRWVQDDWPLSSKLIAVTWVHFDTRSGEIENVDIDFNLAQKPYLAGSECDQDALAYDLLATMTHEVGHWIGLDHSFHPEATMFETTSHGDCVKRTLAEDDLEGFCGIYAGLPAPPEDLGPGEADAGGDTGGGGSGGRRDDDCAGGGAGGGALWMFAALSLLVGRATRRGRRTRGPCPAR